MTNRIQHHLEDLLNMLFSRPGSCRFKSDIIETFSDIYVTLLQTPQEAQDAVEIKTELKLAD